MVSLAAEATWLRSEMALPDGDKNDPAETLAAKWRLEDQGGRAAQS